MAKVRFELLESWTPERAWWWGVLLGDGNVFSNYGTHRVSVVGSATTTARWLALIAPEKHPIPVKHAKDTFQAYVDSKPLVARCTALGVCGPKSHVLPWPEELPAEVVLSFLRGLWDTDGSLSIFDNEAHGRRGNPEVKARYASACRPFVERLRDALEAHVGVPRVAITESRKKTFVHYGVSYAGAAGMLVADALYADAPEHLRNEDRVEVYQRMCALRAQLAEACPCGEPQEIQGKCTKCWWAARERTTGPGTLCTKCGLKPISHKGICSGCASRERRAKPDWERKSTGTCACGKPAFRKGQCDACYSKSYRAQKRSVEPVDNL